MIVDAAFAVARRSGADDINVRKVANELGCSTQPVMYHFKTVEELKEEVYGVASRFYGDYLLGNDEDNGGDLGIKELSSRYLRFARDEAPLFRFIFQSGRFEGDHFDKMFASEDKLHIISNIQRLTGFGEKEAKLAAASVFSAVHGYACIVANGNAEYREDIADSLLENICNAAVAYWKKSGSEKKK